MLLRWLAVHYRLAFARGNTENSQASHCLNRWGEYHRYRPCGFFLKNREKQFAILHCVGQYPTPNADLEIGQIEFLRNRYSDVTVGFSTHEDPSNTGAIKLAIAKGASVFEKHIGVANENVSLNAYSINRVRQDLGFSLLHRGL